MALVALLRGMNVGGHRRFRPAVLARELATLDVVSIGAAGTFVIRRPITHGRLRSELARRLPFEAQVMICAGRDLVDLASHDWFAGERARPDLVQFVSLLKRQPRAAPPLPLRLPSSGDWLVRVLARHRRFVVGVHRRHMKVIGQLAELDRLLGVPITTRTWSTVQAVARTLGHPPP